MKKNPGHATGEIRGWFQGWDHELKRLATAKTPKEAGEMGRNLNHLSPPPLVLRKNLGGFLF